MNIRRISFWCWTASALLIAAALASLALAFCLPYDSVPESHQGTPTITAPPPTHKVAMLTMENFEPFLGKSLRRPTATSQPATMATVDDRPTPSEPPHYTGGLQLIGTVTEDHNNYAVFETSDGVEVKHAGESVSGAQVISIAEGIVVMRNPNGQSQTLRVPAPPG